MSQFLANLSRLRRHWLFVIGIGVLLLTITGIALWVCAPSQDDTRAPAVGSSQDQWSNDGAQEVPSSTDSSNENKKKQKSHSSKKTSSNNLPAKAAAGDLSASGGSKPLLPGDSSQPRGHTPVEPSDGETPPPFEEASSSPTFGSAFPSPYTTGPRTTNCSSWRTVSGTVTSTSNGQVISCLTANKIIVRNDNVTVHDVVIKGTGTYMVTTDINESTGTCPKNVKYQYIEIDGAGAAENDIPIYASCGNISIDHAYVHNVGRSSRLTNNMSVTNSYIYSNRTGSSGAHRGAIGINGGSNNQVINNVLLCSGAGCSASLPNYGDFAPVNGLLLQHNLFATTGSYCAYGGSLSSKPYPEGSNIRFIGNHFSTYFYPTCGHYGVISGFDNGVRGNVWRDNVWHETGRPLDL